MGQRTSTSGHPDNQRVMRLAELTHDLRKIMGRIEARSLQEPTQRERRRLADLQTRIQRLRRGEREDGGFGS